MEQNSGQLGKITCLQVSMCSQWFWDQNWSCPLKAGMINAYKKITIDQRKEIKTG